MEYLSSLNPNAKDYVMKKLITTSLVAATLTLGAINVTVAAEAKKVDDYMPTLITQTPLEGRMLAITIVRKTIGTIQKSGKIKQEVRKEYQDDPELLMQAAELVNKEFAIIAKANNYWR